MNFAVFQMSIGLVHHRKMSRCVHRLDGTSLVRGGLSSYLTRSSRRYDLSQNHGDRRIDNSVLVE